MLLSVAKTLVAAVIGSMFMADIAKVAEPATRHHIPE